MKRLAMTVLVLLLLCLPAFGAGLQPGAKVLCREKGTSFTGTLTEVRPKSEPLLVVNPYGGMVRIPLGEIVRIQTTGKEQRLTLPWLFPEEKTVELFEFQTRDGSRIIGAAERGLSFDIALDGGGARDGVGLDTLELIEIR